MKSKNVLTLGIMMLILPLSHLFAKNETTLHHHIAVQFDIKASQISVSDSLYFEDLNQELTFHLNKNLRPECAQADITLIKEAEGQSIHHTYKLRNNSKGIIITYSGIINDGEETLLTPRHGQSSGTNGIIFEKGIYLSGSTFWVPRFNEYPLVTFNIETTLDSTWSVVSQGNLKSEIYRDGKRISQIEHIHPTNQIYLTANQWYRTAMPVGKVNVEAYLINEDAAIARKYLGATTGFLKIYEERIGPYPYDKFALVENFWETGYGMPAFTLLGKRVIRMPWILYSSYPHELLHNYWGNGVYVDYSTGNWSEGITVYMADHYFKELKGEDVIYRRTALQNFANYVNAKNDFPLTDFKSRTTKASSAIGYDKSMMFNHMLCDKYGNELFNKSYAHFYENHKFTTASYDDIKYSFEVVTNDNLDTFFSQWVKRTGAPELEVNELQIKKSGKRLLFNIAQKQEGELFDILLPINLEYEDTLIETRISINSKNQSYALDIHKGLKKIIFDPYFDVMRILHTSETPSTISGLLGAQELCIFLSEEDPNFEQYKQFAEMFKSQKRSQKISVISNGDYASIDKSTPLLVLGDNPKLSTHLNPDQLALITESIEAEYTSICTIKEEERSIAYLNTSRPTDLISIFMKIQHYGSYSFLSFDKDAKAITKEKFAAKNSSMIFEIN